ncbi:MAG TPA: PAS domain S-box protein [Casimicrobiaceae bacterium]|nr:PAS domain S-box protein [Casimicrobiaceae bacterium]
MERRTNTRTCAGVPPANGGPTWPTGRLLVIFTPVLVLIASTAVLAITAWSIGWYRTELLIAAQATGAAAGVLAMFLLYRQIRQRQETTRDLQSVTARVSDIVESAMDAIITIDAAQRILVFNAAAERVFGWPRDAVLGQPVEKLLPRRFHDKHREHVERFGQTGATARRMGGQTVLTGLRASGEEFPIEASISQHSEVGKKLLTVILRDISERIDAETLLGRSEARLRGILDSAMDAIVTVDGTQHIVLFNAAAEAMFGCPRDEALGAPLAWFLPERFRSVHSEHVRRFGAAGTASRRMAEQRVVTGLRRDGEEFPIDASISQIEERGSKYYTVILRDVSERLRVEGALRQSQEELRELGAAAHAAREQEKSRIARELHDELAQSLTALQMDVAWYKERVPEGQPATSARLARMETLLNETVAATRRIAADLRPLMLDDLGLVPAVEWLVESFTQRSGIPCELAVSDQELELPRAHATAVFRIVQESLANVGKHAQASRVKVAIERNGSELTLSIRDDGAGFSLQNPRKPNSYGLLGLRERASLLGGKASIASAPGEGTHVEVRLPVTPAIPP